MEGFFSLKILVSFSLFDTKQINSLSYLTLTCSPIVFLFIQVGSLYLAYLKMIEYELISLCIFYKNYGCVFIFYLYFFMKGKGCILNISSEKMRS